MKINKVKYSENLPGIVQRHCAAFLTDKGDVILIDRDNEGMFLNTGIPMRIVKNIMKGKKKSTTVIPFPGVITWETTTYDENLVNMAKTGQLINAIVIENVPEAFEELEKFALRVLRETYSD